MPRFTVKALEKFLIRTTYRGVDAKSKGEALARVMDGMEDYDEHSIEEGDEEFISVESVEEEDDDVEADSIS